MEEPWEPARAEPEIPGPSEDSLTNIPLTPTVIQQDPQRDSVTRVVRTTKESVVYVQCPLQDLSGNTQYSPIRSKEDSPAGEN